MYLTYEEYQSYGGTLDETTFTDFEFEAETWIDWYTFNRLQNEDTQDERVKRCVNKLIQLAKMKADALALGSQTVQTKDSEGNVTTIQTTASVASQSNDGVSISYNTISASEAYRALQATESGNLIEMTVKQYLQGLKNSLGRKVLYRGLYPNE